MITSLLKAIDILELFSTDEYSLSLTEVSNRMNQPKTTVHNLLNTMRFRGYIEKTENDRYTLGSALISLTQAVRINVELRDRAAPLLRQLSDLGKPSIYLAALEGNVCLYIYAIESSSRLIARTAIGDRSEMHCTGVGKAILAYLEKAKVEAIIKEIGLKPYTDTTITDKKILFQELEQIRIRGYSIDNQEHEDNNYCLAAPIFNNHNTVIGACSISENNPRIIHEDREERADDLMFTAQEISRRMGFVPNKKFYFWNGDHTEIGKKLVTGN